MPSYAHLTQFSATDPLPLTLGPLVRPATPAPAPCPLQEFERGDHGWPWSAEANSVLRTCRDPLPKDTLVSEGASGSGKAPLDIRIEIATYLSARSAQVPWSPKVGDIVDTDFGPVLRGASVLICRPEDFTALVGSPSTLEGWHVPKDKLRPAVTPKPAAPPAGRQQIRAAWDTSSPPFAVARGGMDETPDRVDLCEWYVATYPGSRIERRTLEA